MAFALDSTQPGFLGPSPTETSTQFDFENFMQYCVAGITGLPGPLVRPRWQPNPPPTPDISVDWAACGITRSQASFSPYFQHHAESEPGYDRFSRSERVTYRVSFYGPHAGDYAEMLRDGLFIDQNRAVWRANSLGLVEAERIEHTADLFRQQFRDRYDLEIILNRQARRIYNVRTLLRAKGTITGNDFGGRIVTDTFDTDLASHVVTGNVTIWDVQQRTSDPPTIWDNGKTNWDA
jgi:hypothetical protein